MKSVFISIKPEFVEALLAGTKRYELRRRFARSVPLKSKILIYATAPVSALVAKATIEDLIERAPSTLWKKFSSEVGVDKKAFDAYFSGVEKGFAIKLSAVQLLAKKIPYAELTTRFGIRPPQSFMYLDKLKCREMIGRHEEGASRYQHLGTSRRQYSGTRHLLEPTA